MLRSMRNNLKSLSWTLWLVILAFIGFIFVQWGSGRFDSEGLDRDVAAVGRSTIGGEEFQKNLARTLEMYRNRFKNNFSRQMIDQMRIAEQYGAMLQHAPLNPALGAADKLPAANADLVLDRGGVAQSGQLTAGEIFRRLAGAIKFGWNAEQLERSDETPADDLIDRLNIVAEKRTGRRHRDSVGDLVGV